MKTLGSISLGALVCLLPSLALAHPGHAAGTGWVDGFVHPFGGLDHIAAMVAVGFWAAQQRGAGKWVLPAAFLLAMALGGFVGACGIHLPGAEIGIGLSVLVLGALAVSRTRVKTSWAIATVTLFAVFHGYAHAVEIPDRTALLTYGFGFLVATGLLHGAGFLCSRAVAFVSALRRDVRAGALD